MTYSGYFTSNARNGSQQVSNVTATLVRPENIRRRRLTLVNNDDNAIVYLFKGAGASANQGLAIYPHGSYEDTLDTQGYVYKGAYTAISTVLNSVLTWCEEYY